MKTVIIGGGISGLSLYTQLVKIDPNVILIEKQPRLGGRINTEYSNDKVLYEKGPWRIHESHKHVLKLCKELNITPSLASESHPDALHKQVFNVDLSRSSYEKYKDISGLTEFGSHLFSTGTWTTLYDELKTGYEGIFDKASNTRNYDIDKGTFYVVKEGLQHIIDSMYDNLSHSQQNNILTDHFVTDVSINYKNNIYTICYYNRDHSTEMISCDRLILCLPPHFTERWEIAKHLKPLINSLGVLSLHHVYVRTKERVEIEGKENFKIITDSPISQVISTNYNNNWTQLSYSAGRIADFWHNLAISHPHLFKCFLADQFTKVTNTTNTILEIKNYYWNQAVHHWKANFRITSFQLMKKSLLPHTLLNDLYVAGEAISTHQGWMEGALETADLVFKKIVRSTPVLVPDLPKEYVIYDGRVIDVSNWKNVHPGSKSAIENHMYEDITALWNSIHPDYASKYLFALEILPKTS